MFTVRRLVFVCIVMVVSLTWVASPVRAEGTGLAPTNFGNGDKTVTEVNLIVRSLPGIIHGKQLGVLTKGTVVTAFYGPVFTQDYRWWYVCTEYKTLCGWVADGKLTITWLTLATGTTHVQTCVAQMSSAYRGFDLGTPTLIANYLVPRYAGTGPLLTQPGILRADNWGNDAIYQYWQVTISDPDRWGYYPGPLGLPQLYYYC